MAFNLVSDGFKLDSAVIERFNWLPKLLEIKSQPLISGLSDQDRLLCQRELKISISAKRWRQGLMALAGCLSKPYYSGFQVAAVLETLEGAYFLGTNIEFPGLALSNTLHAEQVALCQALRLGQTPQQLFVSHQPCGFCRQFMLELAVAAEFKVHVTGAKARSLAQLCPNGFGPHSLDQPRYEGGLKRRRQLVLGGKSGPTALRAAAITAAEASYAPYGQLWAGAAAQLRDGTVLSGFAVENAAFNPSIGALQMLVLLMNTLGQPLVEVKELVVVSSQPEYQDPLLRLMPDAEVHLLHGAQAP